MINQLNHSEGWSILLCVFPPSNQQVAVFVHLQCPKSPGSRPQPTPSNQPIQSPSTHPRRRTSRLNSSRLLESYMASGPFDRLISRSSNDKSVSGNSSALSGRRDRFMKIFTYVSVLWKSKTSMCRQSDTDQRHLCKHLDTLTWPWAFWRYWQTGQGFASLRPMECK